MCDRNEFLSLPDIDSPASFYSSLFGLALASAFAYYGCKAEKSSLQQQNTMTAAKDTAYTITSVNGKLDTVAMKIVDAKDTLYTITSLNGKLDTIDTKIVDAAPVLQQK